MLSPGTWLFIKSLCNGIPRAVMAVTSELRQYGDSVATLSDEKLHAALEGRVVDACSKGGEVKPKDQV